MTAPFNDVDLVELSDLAWELVDPDAGHEAEQQAWTALLPARWPPIATVEALRTWLEAPAQAVYELQLAGYPVDRVSWRGESGRSQDGYRLHRRDARAWMRHGFGEGRDDAA